MMMKTGINSTLCDELIVCSDFSKAAVLEHDDPVGETNGRKAMPNDDRRAS